MKLCPAYPQLYFIVTHSKTIYDNLHDLVLFVQFKKCEKHPERSVTEICNFTKATLLHGCFSRFLDCSNGTKSHIYIVTIKIIMVFQVFSSFWGMKRQFFVLDVSTNVNFYELYPI